MQLGHGESSSAAASRTARIGARPPPAARTTDPPRGAPGGRLARLSGQRKMRGQPAGRPCASHVQDRPQSVCAPRQGIHTASPTLAVGWRPGPRSATPVPRGDLRIASARVLPWLATFTPAPGRRTTRRHARHPPRPVSRVPAPAHDARHGPAVSRCITQQSYSKPLLPAGTAV